MMTRGNEWICHGEACQCFKMQSHQLQLAINTLFSLCCILNYLYWNTHTMHKQRTNWMARSLHLHAFAWDARIGIIYSWAITTCRFQTENNSRCSLSPSWERRNSAITSHHTNPFKKEKINYSVIQNYILKHHNSQLSLDMNVMHEHELIN